MLSQVYKNFFRFYTQSRTIKKSALNLTQTESAKLHIADED